MRLKDKVAVVTGAQQGIGKAIAIAFAREGAKVVVNYLDDRVAADAVVAAILQGGQAAQAVAGDVRRADDIQAMIQAAQALGGLDIWVNNAGIFPRVDFLEMTEDDWQEVQDVNLKGAFLGSRDAARAMVAQSRGGAIVNIASIVTEIGAPRGVHYTASKAGVVGLTRAAAGALAPYAIRVNAIAPGLTDTAQPRDGMTEAEIDEAGAAMPLGRLITPAEIAEAAVFLAAEESRQMTGQTLHVNGGSVFV